MPSERFMRHHYGASGYVKPRDPRRDPIPGDRLRDRSGQIIVVHSLAPGESRDLLLWRKAMKDATVLTVSTGCWNG